ncbi:hypothetical protein [Streptomyces sp. 8L]|uniref:hypothetical protein n=1 Tax=Streptomyces sp. 8L TaxID=2877242 RepID=UPI001CD59C82|nr:hypothetical protein [Streptomyces sp. 8L]MCA1218287.1 hypothetical protein [Streptomyces sp. 8L]
MPPSNTTDAPVPDPTDPLREAARAASELDQALRRAGITLPSLGGDWPAINGQPLVDLGRANLETVSRLVRLANSATPSEQPERP